MKTELAKQISKNQRSLEAVVLSQLSMFTEETGVFVTGIRFDLQVIQDANGDPMACKYYGVRASLSIGAQ